MVRLKLSSALADVMRRNCNDLFYFSILACQYKGEKYQVGQIFFGESAKCTCVKDGNGLKKAECERLEGMYFCLSFHLIIASSLL